MTPDLTRIRRMTLIALVCASLLIVWTERICRRSERTSCLQQSKIAKPRKSEKAKWASEFLIPANEMRQDHSPGTYLGAGYFPTFFNFLSIAEAQGLFHANVMSDDYICKNIKRFGNIGDGGYDVCIDHVFVPKKNDCLVYSFGIRNDWSFDEEINEYFGCDVYSFDPSIGMPNHTHREPNMYFYNLGIWSSNTRNDRKWELRDLTTIVRDLRHHNRIIDYLKVDVEGAEWPLMSHLITSEVHKQIKQVAIELHTPRLNAEFQPMTITDYGEIFQELKEFERLGFRKFRHSANNGCCTKFAQLTFISAKNKLCCYEVVYVNTRF